MKKELSASVWQEGEWFVAQALETDVASQGRSVQEALVNLREALELHFEAPVATISPENPAHRDRGCRQLDPCPTGKY